MPVIRCANGKYRVGSGPCVYKTAAAAQKANKAAHAKKKSK